MVHFINTMSYNSGSIRHGRIGFSPRRGRILCQRQAHSGSFLPIPKEEFWRQRPVNIHHRILMSFGPRSPSTPPRDWATKTSQPDWIRRPRSCVSGANVSSNIVWPGWRTLPAEAGRLAFPPEVVVEVKSLACELPYTYGLPLSRFSMAEIQSEVIGRGLVASIGETTIWRWLSQDAIRPWFHRSWIFPRDPQFAQKAGPILDLYEGIWKGRPLSDADCVVSTDEKTSIQARRREHPSLPPAPRRARRTCLCPPWRPCLLGSLGCSARQDLRTM